MNTTDLLKHPRFSLLSKTLNTLLIASGLILSSHVSSAWASLPAYATVTGNDHRVHFLDNSMQSIANFQLSNSQGIANGIALGNNSIYAGFFSNSTIQAYDFNGILQSSWSDNRLANLQGLALIGNQLVAASNDTAYFFNPQDGSFIRSFATSGNTEGITYDGTYLWEIGNSVIAYDPVSGNILRDLDSPSLACDFGGTGIASSGNGGLTVGCTNGDWYNINNTNGQVIKQGNNGLNMYDLSSQPGNLIPEVPKSVPEPSSIFLMLAGIAGFVRLKTCKYSRK